MANENWNDPLITALNRDGSDVTPELLTTELITGGSIDELARAAQEHGIMITLSFIPGTIEDDIDE